MNLHERLMMERRQRRLGKGKEPWKGVQPGYEDKELGKALSDLKEGVQMLGEKKDVDHKLKKMFLDLYSSLNEIFDGYGVEDSSREDVGGRIQAIEKMLGLR